MLIKKSIIFILIILITLSPVYSISLLPKQQSNIYSNFKIIKVLYDKQYTSQVYLESITSKIIDGFQITVKYENSQDTITIYNQLDSYSTKQYSFKVNQLNPSSLEIRSITNNNHKLVFSTPLTYTFTGNEQPIQEQQPSITTIQQQEQQLVNNPQYISYTSISKLDNNKDIVYFTKDHISSNRITTNQQGDIEYQANYQPYGSIFTETGQEKYKFSGKELDSSNLYYFGARYYNTNIGRFTQVDPIFKAEESPYSYVNNNPIKYVDPTGKQTEGERQDSTRNEQLPTFYFPEVLIEGRVPEAQDSLKTNPSAPWFPEIQNELSPTDFHEALRETFTPELSKTSETIGLIAAWCSVCVIGYETAPQVITFGNDLYKRSFPNVI